MSGFVSERSIEYNIIQELYDIFKDCYDIILPVFYQKRRENTIIANSSFIDKYLKVFALFARRPKTRYIYNRDFEIKFNSTIIEQSNLLSKKDIPTLACAPLGTSLEDVSFGCLKNWYYLHSNIPEEDIYLEYRDKKINDNNNLRHIEIINTNELKGIVDSMKFNTWNNIQHKIEEFYHEYYDYYHLYRNYNLYRTVNTYRPVFVLLG